MKQTMKDIAKLIGKRITITIIPLNSPPIVRKGTLHPLKGEECYYLLDAKGQGLGFFSSLRFAPGVLTFDDDSITIDYTKANESRH